MWDSFACAWDEIVDDLREGDLLSNRERDNLRFIRLGYSLAGVRPILLPHFWTAGQVQKVRNGGAGEHLPAALRSPSLLMHPGCRHWPGGHSASAGAGRDPLPAPLPRL